MGWSWRCARRAPLPHVRGVTQTRLWGSSAAYFLLTTPSNQNATLGVPVGVISLGLAPYCTVQAAQETKAMRAAEAMAIALGATPR